MSTIATGGNIQVYWWNVFQQKRALGAVSDNEFLHLHGDWSSLHLEEPSRVLREEKIRKHMARDLVGLLLDMQFDLSQIDKVLSICEMTEEFAESVSYEIYRLVGRGCPVTTSGEECQAGDTVLFVDSLVDFTHTTTVSVLAKQKGLIIVPYILALSDGGHKSVPGVGEIVSLVQEVPR